MRICIYGAGSIGGYLAALLAEAGHAVSVIARGPHLAAIQARGLTLRFADRVVATRPQASDDPAALGPQDAVILAVKAPALAAIAAGLPPLLGPETMVVAAMNGIPWWFFHGFGGPHDGHALTSVDPGGVLRRGIPIDRVIGCVIHAAASVPEPGVILHNSGDRFVLGEPGGGTSARCGAMVAAMRGPGVDASESPRIQDDVWMKFLGNMSFGPVSGLTHGTIIDIALDPGTRALCARMMEEARAVGDRLGLRPGLSVEARIELGATLGAFRSSMLQDFELGRPPEIDALLAVAVEMAGMVGVPVPTLEAVLALVAQKARLMGIYAAPAG